MGNAASLGSVPWTTSAARFQIVQWWRGVAFLKDPDRALIMKFDMLTPVAGPPAGPADDIQGIAGGGLDRYGHRGATARPVEGQMLTVFAWNIEINVDGHLKAGCEDRKS